MVVTHFMRVKMLDPNKHGIFNKESKMDMKNTIKAGLGLMSCVCLYNVLTTYDIMVFMVSVSTGIFSTWMLLTWERNA